MVVPYVALPKLYSNALTLILNNRITILGGRDDINLGNSVALWSTKTAPRWSIHARSKRVGPIPNEAGDNIVTHEVWRDAATNSDCLEVVSTSPTIISLKHLTTA